MPAFRVTIVSGLDQGQTFEGGADRACLIGRCDAAQLRISDPAVSWEHARVVMSNNHCVLENLSALGTGVNQNRVTQTVRLRPGDHIHLSPRCVAMFEGPGGPGWWVRGALLVVVAAILLVLIGFATGAFDRPARRPALREVDFARVQEAMDMRLRGWVARGKLPDAVLVSFRKAWRLDRAGDHARAAAAWSGLWSELLTLDVAGLGTTHQPIGAAPRAGQLGDDRYAELVELLRASSTAGERLNQANDEAALRVLHQFVRDRYQHMSQLVAREKKE